MINLDKMNSQFDNLKSMDAAQLGQAVKAHQNTIIKLLLVIGTVFLGMALYNDYLARDKSIHARTVLLQQKLDAIKARDAAIQGLNDFKATQRKKISEYDLITLISSYAKSYGVSISSLSPAESQDMGLYDLININLSATSGDFKSLMFFLRKIEKSEFSLRVNSWTGHEEENGKIDFTVQISAVLMHP